MELAEQKCTACQGGIPPLKGKALAALTRQVPSWKVIDEHHLEKVFSFEKFKDTIGFVMKVAMLAEENGHHPVMHVEFRKLTIQFWTHKIDGIHESDCIMAAKMDRL